MRPVDIEKLVALSRPAIAPDGSFAIVASSRPDLAANQNVGQLWRIPLAGEGTPRRLTAGVADGAPRLSPDGSVIAFLRADSAQRPQLFVVAASGGEPMQVTERLLGVGSFAWSPDGVRLAFTSRVPERGRYGDVEGLDASAEAPRHITGIRWNANGLGYTNDRPAGVFIVDVPAVDSEPVYPTAPAVIAADAVTPGKRLTHTDPVSLTSAPADHVGVVFTADGTEVLTVQDEVETLRRDLRSRVTAVRVDGSGQREVLSREAGLSVDAVAVAADGTIALLAFEVGDSHTDFVAPGVGLWVIEDDSPRLLTDVETIDLGGSDLVALGEDFVVMQTRRGRVVALIVTRGGEVTELLGGDVEIAGIDAVLVDAEPLDGGVRAVAAVATPTSFGELVVADATGVRTVTDFGAPLRATGLAAPVELTIEGRDGYPVHGWLGAPDGAGPHPVILMIHGGPYAQYGVHPFDEVQTLVAAGYAVAYCNPRGSAGYGRAHGRSIRHQMGTLDHVDVIDFLDGVIASNPALDDGRVGVMGGSYGGYLTAWLTSHDHRFAAAIVERGFLDPVSFQGTSDIGSFFGEEYVGTDAAAIAAQSPMAHVADVTTPTLVIHSELDLRCPLEQATRYYLGLKSAGVDAEMLIFPGENHELTRSGQPRHRVERLTAVLDWWERKLPVVR